MIQKLRSSLNAIPQFFAFFVRQPLSVFIRLYLKGFVKCDSFIFSFDEVYIKMSYIREIVAMMSDDILLTSCSN